jgi:hypothetical protein
LNPPVLSARRRDGVPATGLTAAIFQQLHLLPTMKCHLRNVLLSPEVAAHQDHCIWHDDDTRVLIAWLDFAGPNPTEAALGRNDGTPPVRPPQSHLQRLVFV